MGMIVWMFVGFVLGATAKLYLPGRAPGGVIGTILVGVGGAVVAGLVGAIFGIGGIAAPEFRSACLSFIGALSSLFGFRLYVDRAEA